MTERALILLAALLDGQRHTITDLVVLGRIEDGFWQAAVSVALDERLVTCRKRGLLTLTEHGRAWLESQQRTCTVCGRARGVSALIRRDGAWSCATHAPDRVSPLAQRQADGPSVSRVAGPGAGRSRQPQRSRRRTRRYPRAW